MNIEDRFAAAKERQQNGDKEGAAWLYQSVLADEPTHVGALNNLGVIMKEQGRLESALICYRRALNASPRNADILHNIARCSLVLEAYDSAHKCAAEAIRVDPTRAEFWHTKALALHGRGMTGALAAYDKALELSPDAPQILWDRSLFLLSIGNYAEGWRHHDSRFDWYHKQVRKVPMPLWEGEDPAGKTIAVTSDQGFGDAIMAWRFIPELADLGARVVLDLPGELLGLFPDVPGVTVRPLGSALPDADWHLPLASLPGRMGCQLETLRGGAYLSAEPALATSRPSVGLVWNGTTDNPRDNERSIPLEMLVRICATPGIDFYSFQKGAPAVQLPLLGANVFLKDLAPLLPDFAATARHLASMDLLISVDTAVAHLGGALGLETWLMIAASPDWRWGWGANSTPWYDSIRIFRQKHPRSWDSVVHDIQTQLVVWSHAKENRHAASDPDRPAAGLRHSLRTEHADHIP